MENDEQQARRKVEASNRQYRRLMNSQLVYDSMLPPEDSCDEVGAHKRILKGTAPDGTQLFRCSKCGKENLS